MNDDFGRLGTRELGLAGDVAGVVTEGLGAMHALASRGPAETPWRRRRRSSTSTSTPP